MNNKVNKAGVTPRPVETYDITSSDVTNYLENKILGFKIGCDFTRWTGVSPESSYVRMRAVITPKDIVSTVKDKDYVSKILAENNAGLCFKEDVINSLKQFMYPASIINLKNQPNELQRMYQCGLYGDRLDELISNASLTYAEPVDLFKVYLRPERIIADMLADPNTGEIDGDFAIIGVHGTTSETIRWEAIVSHNNALASSNNLNIDAIFNRRA